VFILHYYQDVQLSRFFSYDKYSLLMLSSSVTSSCRGMILRLMIVAAFNPLERSLEP